MLEKRLPGGGDQLWGSMSFSLCFLGLSSCFCVSHSHFVFSSALCSRVLPHHCYFSTNAQCHSCPVSSLIIASLPNLEKILICPHPRTHHRGASKLLCWCDAASDPVPGTGSELSCQLHPLCLKPMEVHPGVPGSLASAGAQRPR